MIFILRKNVFGNKKRYIPSVPFYLLKLACKRKKRQKFVSSGVTKLFRKNVLILRPFLLYKFLVHFGKMQKVFIINTQNIGFKFGEFFMTRRFGSGSMLHVRKKKKSAKK